MRIVAGRWRGRRLAAPRGQAVRPTLDRVRESIFALLGERVAGAAVLDLFAGTGAMALEALSRGASSAVLVEADPRAFGVLTRNVASLGAGEADPLLMDFRRAVRVLKGRGRRFDLAFLDPPYGRGLASAAALALERAGLLNSGGAAVVEDAARAAAAPFPAGWERAADRVYGETRVVIFEVRPGPAGGRESGGDDAMTRSAG